jgi:hypothetical protein
MRVYDPLGGTITVQQTPATATIGPFSSLLVVEGPDVTSTSNTASP